MFLKVATLNPVIDLVEVGLVTPETTRVIDVSADTSIPVTVTVLLG